MTSQETLGRMVEDYKTMRRESEAMQELMTELRQQIQFLLGTQQELKVGRYKIRWKQITTSRFDVESFKQSNPRLYRKFCREIQSRRFQII